MNVGFGPLVISNKRGEKGTGPGMDANKLRMMAQRCRDLLRFAMDDQVRAQLREWADDLEDEADMAENHRGWHVNEDIH